MVMAVGTAMGRGTCSWAVAAAVNARDENDEKAGVRCEAVLLDTSKANGLWNAHDLQGSADFYSGGLGETDPVPDCVRVQDPGTL